MKMIIEEASIHPFCHSGAVADEMMKVFLESGAHVDAVYLRAIKHPSTHQPYKVTFNLLGISASFQVLFDDFAEQIEFVGKLNMGGSKHLPDDFFRKLSAQIKDIARGYSWKQ